MLNDEEELVDRCFLSNMVQLGLSFKAKEGYCGRADASVVAAGR